MWNRIIVCVEKTSKVLYWMLLWTLAFGLGRTGITGEAWVLNPVSRVQGYILITCSVILFFSPIVLWIKGKIKNRKAG